MSYKKFGIDISAWQGLFDMDRAKAEGVEFVIAKGGGADDGYYVDSKFERNYANAKRLGLPVGAYFFSRALNEEQALAEADYFYARCLKGKQFELPVYLDVENKRQLGIGRDLLTKVIKAFCDRLEELGYLAGIYMSLSPLNGLVNDSELGDIPRWVAQYYTECEYRGDLGMWQFGGGVNYIRSKTIAGQTIDQNYLYKDYESEVKARGLNGWKKGEVTPVPEPKPEPKPVPAKTVEELAKEVIRGSWGNGGERERRLTEAGYNYAEVQEEVNRILTGAPAKPKKSIPQLAVEVLKGQWGNGDEREKKLRASGYDYNAVQSEVNKLHSGLIGITAVIDDLVKKGYAKGDLRGLIEERLK